MYRGLATPFVIEAHGPTGGLATSLDRLSAGLLGTLSLGTLLVLLRLGSRFLPSFSPSLPLSSFGRALTHRLTGTTAATIYDSFAFPPLRLQPIPPLNIVTPGTGPMDHVRTPGENTVVACLTRGAPCFAPSTVCGLGWGDAYAAPLAPGRAARRPVSPLFDLTAAGAPRRRDTTSTTSPSATRAAGALWVLESTALHWMVWRTGVDDDDAQGCHRGLPSTERWARARTGLPWPWRRLFGAEAVWAAVG